MLIRLAQLAVISFPLIGALECFGQPEPTVRGSGQEQQRRRTAPATTPTGAAGEISGQVLRADTGRPLPKAVVTLTPEGRPSETTSVRTETTGTFHFSEVAPGRYRLRAERSGYVRQVYGQRAAGPGTVVTLGAGQRLEAVEFRLEPAGVISGSVTDEDSEPAEGLEVRALRVRFAPGGRQDVSIGRTTRTDDLGNFRLPGLSPGSYYVQAGGRGEGVSIGGPTPAFSYSATYFPGVLLREEAQRVHVAAGGEARGIDFSVRSTPTFNVSGLVVDTVPGSSTRRYSIGFARGGGMATTSMDPHDGSFTLRGVAPGDYALVAIASDESGSSRRGYRNVRVLDADVRVTIDIGRTAEVRGEVQVEDSSDFRFSGLHISLQPEVADAVTGDAFVEEKGKFVVKDIPEGRYTFQLQGREQEMYLKQVRCAGEDYTTRGVSLAADQVLEGCTLRIARDVAEVSGQVTKEDLPVAGAVVVLIPAEAARRFLARHTATGQTDPNGQFQIRGVIPGEYFIFAVAASGDGIYYDPEFANRNRESTERLSVKPKEQHRLSLKPIQPL